MASDPATSSAQTHYDRRVENRLSLSGSQHVLPLPRERRELAGSLEAIRPDLEATGTRVEIRKTLVESAQQTCDS